MLLKLVGSHVVHDTGGTLTFVATATLFHAILTPWLAAKFPRFLWHNYEPLFFDATLSFADKVMRWRTQPAASLLAVAVLSVG